MECRKLKRLRKTADLLGLLNFSKKRMETENLRHMIVVSAGLYKSMSYEDINKHIGFCKKTLREGLK